MTGSPPDGPIKGTGIDADRGVVDMRPKLIRKDTDIRGISIVVPLKDEGPTLPLLYERLKQVLEDMGETFELVFVDDGSTDESPEILTAMTARDPRVRVFRLRRNFGKAAALATGFREAHGDVVITMDADLQDDPTDIPRLIALIRAGYDVVSGWKRDRKDPASRKIASRVFNWATRRMSRVRLHDFNCGFKAYTGEAARELADACYGELHRYLPVLAHWRGFRVTEVAVTHHARTHGRSRYGLERYTRGLLDLVTASYLSRYLRRPMHVFGGIGLLLFFPGMLTLGWLMFDRFALGHSIGRVALVIGAGLAIAGLQLILTGLLAEMVSGPRASEVPYTPVMAPRMSPAEEEESTPDRGLRAVDDRPDRHDRGEPR